MEKQLSSSTIYNRIPINALENPETRHLERINYFFNFHFEQWLSELLNTFRDQIIVGIYFQSIIDVFLELLTEWVKENSKKEIRL